jgi:hypothetical protein
VTERTRAELLDAELQRLEPSGQPAHHRVRAGGDREEEDDQDHDQPGAARQAGNEERPGGRRDPGTALVAAAAAASPPPRLAHAASHRPERSAVVEAKREGAADTLLCAALERLRGADAAPLGVVEGERNAQALRPVAQRRELRLGRGLGTGQRMVEQLGPGAEALARDLLVADAFVVEMALEHPAGDQGEEQQHHHHGGVDAQVEALHPARARHARRRGRELMPRRRRRPASSRTRSRHRAP